MVKLNTNPFKFKVYVVDAYFYYRDTKSTTFEGLDQEGRPIMLKVVREKHIMLKVSSTHRRTKNIVPYVKLMGSFFIKKVND